MGCCTKFQLQAYGAYYSGVLLIILICVALVHARVQLSYGRHVCLSVCLFVTCWY